MQNFEALGRELERRGKTEQIRRLAESADGKSLGAMIDAEAVEKAARSGDSEALGRILRRVLSTGEGQRLAADIRKLMKD